MIFSPPALPFQRCIFLWIEYIWTSTVSTPNCIAFVMSTLTEWFFFRYPFHHYSVLMALTFIQICISWFPTKDKNYWYSITGIQIEYHGKYSKQKPCVFFVSSFKMCRVLIDFQSFLRSAYGFYIWFSSVVVFYV